MKEIGFALDYARCVIKNNVGRRTVVLTYYDSFKSHRKYKIACYGANAKSIDDSYKKIKSVFDVMWPEYEVSTKITKRYCGESYHSIIVRVKK